HCDTLKVGSCGYGGTFSQTGGDFSVGSITMGDSDLYGYSVSCRFSLSGGTARADSISISRGGSGDQSAGLLTVNSLSLHGVPASRFEYYWIDGGGYGLRGGVLVAGSEDLSLGGFGQTGGTNTISGSLNLGGDQYVGSPVTITGPSFG